jgi:polyisoprenoid-binding protein YceI
MLKRRLLIFLCGLLTALELQAQCWRPADSSEPVRFTASQSGAPIVGAFGIYRGKICLPSQTDKGSASVEVETASIDMGPEEFNAQMRGPLFFYSAQWPTASFTADQVEAAGGNSYRFSGTLTIRDISRPLTSVIKLTPEGDHLRATGEIRLSRLEFDIGTGEWADTRWVGDEVTITLDNRLVPAP